MVEASAPMVRFSLFFGGLVFFLILELSLPYRSATIPRLGRWVNNLLIVGFNNILIYLIFSDAIARTLSYGEYHRTGILNIIDIPYGFKVLIAVIFLDFITYVWHLLNHEVPLLWRFHRVHHCDLNMDVSTATRFHFGELSLSAVIRLSLIFFLGADLFSLLIFDSLVVVATQFHHSSVKVPRWFETFVWLVWVPPSMHRIHHSVVIKERDANYGVLFSLWDRILGTLVTRTDQDRIKIGVGAYQDPEKLRFHHLLAMPFTRPIR